MTSKTYGKRRVPRLIAKISKHRALVRSEGTPMIQESWDEIEEFVDFLFQEVAGNKPFEAS